MLKSWTFGTKIATAFALSVSILVIVGIVAYRSTDLLIDNDHKVTHSHAVIEQVSRLLTLANDAETGQRGYVITGDESYLEPYVNGVAGVPHVVDELRGLTADSPKQQRLVEEAHALLDVKFAELKLTIEMRRTAGLEATTKEVLTGRGKKAMDDLRVVLASMEGEEHDLLQRRAEAAEVSAAGAKSTIVFGVALAFVFVTFAGVLITRSLNSQLGSAIASIQSSSTELQAAATQQATGSRQQSSATTEVTTTIRELMSTSRQIAESAQSVARIAQETVTGARTGDQTVQRTQEAIGAIRRQVELIVSHMLDLGKKSQQAGGILELVNELSEQTNILAINATIEAAGAGEAGKRFAVVAEEIRKLADRVGASTKEIRTLIDDIRAAVNATVMATESGTKTVEAGARQFAEVTEAFKRIAELIGTTTDAAREIELSTKQQATAVEQVNMAISSVAQASKETEVSSSQTLQTATQLSGLSRELLLMIQANARG